MSRGPSPETATLADAFTLASLLHREQRRKGPGQAPYVSHLLTVAGLVIEFGGTQAEAAAALLHDAVEDQGGEPTLQLIRRLFGEEVAAIVEGCTDADTIPKPPWRERKERFVACLRDAHQSVVLVVLADKIANMRSTIRDLRSDGESIWDRFKGGRDGTLWYYRTIRDSAMPSDARVQRLIAEYESVLSELEAAAERSHLLS